MLLSNATVVSLDDGVLTLRFARDGDVKGFTTSGCDADLKRVLAAQFGLSVRIRALSANDPAAGGREPRPRLNAVPDQPAARPDGGGRERAALPSHPDAAGGGEDAGNIPGQDRPVSAGAGSPAPSAGGHGAGSNAVSTAPDASPAGDTPGAPAANRRPAATASPAAGGSPAGQPASSGPARPGAGSRSAGGQPAGRAGFGPGVEEAIDIPDAEDIASPGQAGISGMDLIQRELGGQIIGEIED
jgi:DNA polymerase-3 subunit gamma/tau